MRAILDVILIVLDLYVWLLIAAAILSWLVAFNVVNSRNQVEEREIHTGIEGSNRIQILSGLNEGDRVIVGNLGEYRSGQQVDPRMSTMAEEKYTAEKGAQ